MSIKVAASTMGRATLVGPATEKPYRFKKRPGWTGADAPPDEPEGEPRGSGIPASHRNSPESRERRFRLFCAAMDAGKGYRDAGIAAGVGLKTAQRYKRDWKALLVAAEVTAASPDGQS